MSGLRRSDRAKYAAQVFYREFNEVDIFIEDTAVEAKKIYVNLLRRVLGDVRFSQVFPIGSKERVYERCAADQGERARPAVYIVDGDHDQLMGKPLPNLRRLYCLKRYCVENYLFDEEAAISYLDDEVANQSREDIAALLAFREWRESMAEGLVPHVRALVVAHRKGCGEGLPRANVRVSELSTSNDGSIDEMLVARDITICRERVDGKCGAGEFDLACESLNNYFAGGNAGAMLRFVSGKVVLLPLLRKRMRSLFGVSTNDSLFRLRLAKYCDVTELKDIVTILA